MKKFINLLFVFTSISPVFSIQEETIDFSQLFSRRNVGASFPAPEGASVSFSDEPAAKKARIEDPFTETVPDPLPQAWDDNMGSLLYSSLLPMEDEPFVFSPA